MAAASNKDQVISFLTGRSRTNRGLLLALSSILILLAVGFTYLLIHFHSVAGNSAAAISASGTRYALLLSSYQQTVDAYYLADQGYTTPAERSSLVPSFVQKQSELRAKRAEYSRLLEEREFRPSVTQSDADSFFVLTDSLLDRVSGVFDAPALPSGRLSLPKQTQVLFSPAINDYFRRLRTDLARLTSLEMESNSRVVLQARDATTEAAVRWFVVSGFLFLFAGFVATVLISVERRATSLVRQFKTILDHYVNPLVVTSPSGNVLYVNAEFEHWSGTPQDHLLGRNVYSGMTVHNGTSAQVHDWPGILKSLETGKAWTGEVETRHALGKVTSSILIMLPILGEGGRIEEVVNVFHDTTEKKILARTIEEAREQYQSLVESSLDGIVVVQQEKLVFVNPAAVRIFRYESDQEMKTLRFIDTVAPASRPFLTLDYSSRPRGEEILKNYEMKGLTKDGKLIDVEVNARIISWNGLPALHASFRDISERKSLERQQAVWLWEQETLSSIDRQLLGIVDLQKVLDIILQQIALLTRAHVVGVAMVDTESQQAHWRATRGTQAPVIGELFRVTPATSKLFYSREHLVVEDCDHEKPLLADIPPLESEGVVSIAVFPLLVNSEPRGRLIAGFRQSHHFAEREIRVLSSMAEKASIALTSGELYEDLLHREKELEMLSGARVQAQEEERRRISREIHDGLGQLLTAIKFNLEIFEDTLPRDGETKQRITDMKDLLDSVMKEAREISYNLLPSVLDDFGLGPGLVSLCEQFSKGTGLRVTFHEHGLKDRLSGDVEIGLYRIVQEALNNVAKHAEAKEVEVQIVRHANLVRLTIEDDGKGMVVHPPDRRTIESGGTGLVSMRERASSLNGTLMIDSTPGKGTTINVDIPLNVN